MNFNPHFAAIKAGSPGGALSAVGTLICVLTAVVCLLPAWRARRGRLGSTVWGWLVVGVLEIILAVEKQWHLRDVLYGASKEMSQSNGTYADRRGPQLLVIIAVSVNLVLLLALAIRLLRFHHWTLRLAVAGVGLSLLTVLVDMISYHYIDTVMHFQIGPAVVAGWLWLAGVLLVMGTAIRAQIPRSSGRLRPG